MATFRLWFENQEQKLDNIRDIWNRIFHELTGNLEKKDALSLPLEKVKGGTDKAPSGTIILRKLNQFFQNLLSIDQAYFKEKIDEVQKWLGQTRDDDDTATAPHRTIRGLMEKLFGADESDQKYGNLYSKLSGEKEIEAEPMKAPPQPPNAESMPEQPPTDEEMPQQNPPGQQPQMPQQPTEAPPTDNPEMSGMPNGMPPTPPPLYKMGVY